MRFLRVVGFAAWLAGCLPGCNRNPPVPPARHASPAMPATSSAPSNDADEPIGRGKNLLLITLDTTRADVLGCYSGDPSVSPCLDRLAARGAQFLRAYSQLNCTTPSHLSILSGRMAIEHDVFDNVRTRRPQFETLPVVFQRAGYQTGAFLAAPHMAEFGWSGFATPRLLVSRPHEKAIAGGVSGAARKWLARRDRRKPFFVWAHYFDPHAEYAPPADVRNQFCPEADGKPASPRHYLAMPPEPNRQTLREKHDQWIRQQALYAGEVHYVDREIRRLLQTLRELKVDRDTVIVVVADHGESLGEHDIYYDHVGLYEPSVHVPLIIVVPGLPKGLRPDGIVTHIDLAPTILELFGLEMQGPLEGISLAPLLKGEPCPQLGARKFIIHEAAQNRQIAVRAGDWKLIVPCVPDNRRVMPPLPNETELFNLRDDPREAINVAAENPDIVAELRPHLSRWTARGLVLRRPRTQRERDQLRELGYLHD